MTPWRGVGVATVTTAVATLVLTACAPAPKRPQAEPAAERRPAVTDFEQRHREKALAATREQRWSEAADHWQILALAHPAGDEYARRADEARARARQASDERLQAAAEARRRGSADQASQLYLRALVADPGNSAALQALRQIEKERSLRGNNNKSARSPYTSRPARETAPAPAAPAATTPTAAERRELDSGVMLFHQGEYANSIRTLETYLKGAPRDELGRRYLARASVQLGQQRLQQGSKGEALALFEKAGAADAREAENIRGTAASLRKSLADDYYQQGLRAYNTSIRAAIDHWERSLKLDPQHPHAAIRLKQARQADQKLRSIESAPARR